MIYFYNDYGNECDKFYMIQNEQYIDDPTSPHSLCAHGCINQGNTIEYGGEVKLEDYFDLKEYYDRF